MELLSTLYAALQLTIVWFFVQLVLIIKGISKMMDMLPRRMLDSINHYSPNKDSGLSLVQFSRQKPQRRSRRDNFKDAEANLFALKLHLPHVMMSQRSTANGLTCFCIKSISAIREDAHTAQPTASLKNILNYCPATKHSTILSKFLNHLAQVYELKKYHYPQVESVVIADERVKHAVDSAAVLQFQDSNRTDDELYQKLWKQNQKRAASLLRDMRSKLSDFLLRFTSWVLYKLLPCFLSAVVVHPDDVEMLQEASKTNLPMIFLPLHRSHLDYILMSFILLNNDIRCPLVASGDNLRIPFFGSLLRGLGAFFIKRRVDPVMGRKDVLYKTIFNTYMNECLRAGHNIEFFLEGGRTRTGKPCMPKYGILSVIVEAVMDGTVEDALLVPVSLNYEKLVDGHFVREQLGQLKVMETFGSAIQGIWHVLNSNYGMIRVDFNKPFSLRKMIQTFNINGHIPAGLNKLKSNPSNSSLYGTDVVSDEHKAIVESISKHVIYDCSIKQAVMSTNAVAFLLLNKFRNGATMQALVDALDELKAELITKGKTIGFTADNLDVINYSITLLGPSLVRKDKEPNEFIRPITVLPNVIELAYYSNSLLPTFSLDSVLAISLFSMDLSDGYVNQVELIETSLQLCNYLQYEFIFCKSCQSLEDNIRETIDNLVHRECFVIDNFNDNYRRNGLYLDCDADADERDFIKPIRMYLRSNGKQHLLFLRSLLMPLLDAYAVTASCLTKLVGRTFVENELVMDILLEMQMLLSVDSLYYEEAVSVDSIRNALKLYQKLDLVELHCEKKVRLFYLKDDDDNAESIRKLCDHINTYRREQLLNDGVFDKYVN